MNTLIRAAAGRFPEHHQPVEEPERPGAVGIGRGGTAGSLSPRASGNEAVNRRLRRAAALARQLTVPDGVDVFE